MRKWLAAGLAIMLSLTISAGNSIRHPQVKSLQAVVNDDWLAAPAIMLLGTDDVLRVSFDELSHDYHRYTYRIERCEADWQPSEGVFESDWLEGFNDNVIEDYATSVNTIVPYTHYQFELPNDRCRLKISGNYRMLIIDDEEDIVASVEFMVAEQTMTLSLEATTNTDIDLNERHQQLSVSLNYGSLRVTNPEEQIRLVVMQNGRQDHRRQGISPTFKSLNGLEWKHAKELIYEAGNEYRKYEVLDPSHPTMGIDRIVWDGENYQVYPFINEPRKNYIYDVDADGAFCIRNSDNRENDTASEYVYVNYRLKTDPLPSGNIIIDAQWTTEPAERYVMTYDASDDLWQARILQKQGYYSYQYLLEKEDGTRCFLPSEGSFYQTQNTYQALIYYKGTGERTWRITAFRGIQLASYDESDRITR